MSSTQTRLRWFRFSLRTLLVLVTVLCFLASWSKSQFDLIREREAFLDREEIGWNTDDVQAPGVLWLFGEHGCWHVFVPYGDHQSASEAKRLFPEARCVWFWPSSRGPLPNYVDLGERP